MSRKMREKALSCNLIPIFYVFFLLVIIQSNPPNQAAIKINRFVTTLLHLQRLDSSAVIGVCKYTWSVLNDRKGSESDWMRYYPDSHNICPPQTYNRSTDSINRLFLSSDERDRQRHLLRRTSTKIYQITGLKLSVYHPGVFRKLNKMVFTSQTQLFYYCT
jgi:hypothetical protein